jgi:putative transposase
MSRHRSPLIAHRHDARLRRVQALKTEHPFWGYRRLWTSLRFVEQWPVNKKRGLRLMREYHPVVPTTLKLKVKRTPTGSKPRATKPREC